MKYYLLLLFLLSSVLVFAQKTKQDVMKSIDAGYDQYTQVANKIWEYAEVGYQETKSSALLQETLSQAGFKIEKGVAGMPTAFIASYGTGKPVIGILGEYDALPGVSQDAVPELKKVEGRPAGHACGHHLFGTASAAAAIAVKDWLIANKKGGTIRFYGTPAEEGGSGKVYMVREGLFKDVDVVFHWHPGAQNNASAGSSLANKTGKFRFYGIASHAAAAPDRGRSALDGVEAMNDMVNMMREHVTQESRIHYVITRGGEAPNVVPAFAEVYYYARHPSRAVVKDMWERLTRAAQGAALGTDTKVEWEITGGVYDLLPNEALARVVDANLRAVGGYTYREGEKDFATKIQKTFTTETPNLTTTNTIGEFKVSPSGVGFGSTDVGDVSWVVPTAGLSTATWVPGTAAHSWQAVAAGGTSIGYKGMMMAAKTLALSMMDVYTNPTLIDNAWKEFRGRTGENFKYEALIGDRPPALDYRK
ncbi:MAG: amidohydrolase [Flammeovirgaceae bacterium]|jgi:aminobenzoyl-glutamate utilization protein B|nr:amidohydrolase [Flammeovirgaceae bacterium]